MSRDRSIIDRRPLLHPMFSFFCFSLFKARVCNRSVQGPVLSVQSANLSAPSLTFCLVAVWSPLLSCYNLACRRRDRSDRHSSGKNHWARQVAAAYVHHGQELTFELYSSFFFPSYCRCLQARLTRVRFLGAAFVSKRSREKEKKKKRNRAVTVQ